MNTLVARYSRPAFRHEDDFSSDDEFDYNG